MKKLLTLALVTVLVLSLLTACGGGVDREEYDRITEENSQMREQLGETDENNVTPTQSSENGVGNLPNGTYERTLATPMNNYQLGDRFTVDGSNITKGDNEYTHKIEDDKLFLTSADGNEDWSYTIKENSDGSYSIGGILYRNRTADGNNSNSATDGDNTNTPPPSETPNQPQGGANDATPSGNGSNNNAASGSNTPAGSEESPHDERSEIEMARAEEYIDEMLVILTRYCENSGCSEEETEMHLQTAVDVLWDCLNTGAKEYYAKRGQVVNHTKLHIDGNTLNFAGIPASDAHWALHNEDADN